jgi:cell division protein FtsX
MVKKLKLNTSNVKKRIANKLSNIAIESVILSIFLVMGSFLFISNIVRVITTSKSNYSTFLEERESLAQIKSVNSNLKDEYEYVSSDESLALYRERHKEDQKILAALDELSENPLGAVLNIKAKSILTDTDFIYPINEANELMAYQCAINFKRKENGDLAPLMDRIDKIWYRFMEVLKRDEGLPERRTVEAPYFYY